MQCSQCGHDNLPQAKFCAKCGAPVAASRVSSPSVPPPPPSPGPPPVPPPGQPPSGKLIYPSNPPQSPHLAWINILIPGLSQILMGQTAKGIVLLVSSYVLLVVGIGALVWLASIIDGYLVGQVLQSGRPVGEWQFFPS